MKHFACVAPAPDSDLLAALVAHHQFRDGYIGGPVGEHNVHGPYRLDAVRPDVYELVEPSTAHAWIAGFFDLFNAPPAAALASDLRQVVERRVGEANAVYRLPELPNAQHEVGWILSEFRELVLVNRAAAELSLVVMGID